MIGLPGSNVVIGAGFNPEFVFVTQFLPSAEIVTGIG